MSTFATAARCFAVAALTTAAALSAAAPADAAGTSASSPEESRTAASCASPLKDKQRLDATLTGDVTEAQVRSVNALNRTEYTHLVTDDTTWLDECSRVYFAEETVPAHDQDIANPAPAAAANVDVFDLSSRPNSNRTIYLDFDGASHTGTVWNKTGTLDSPAYSIDEDRATFNETERAQIYLAWRAVAEDYAPFDVNVTTRVPAADALTRTTASDPTYGTTVVITPTNSAGATCYCGGLAYVGVFGNPSSNAYHPAFVYTNGTGTSGYNVGQAISHEAGHTLGLIHDATPGAGYYAGANGYGPIMGSSYNRRVSHWSRGEYANATNTEDDIAIIAGVAPLLGDDHAGTSAGATPLTAGASIQGLINTRTDTDAFTFIATGPTRVTATGPAGVSNVDVRLTILDESGNVVADINPIASTATDATMAATWEANLTQERRLTAVVDGTGYGEPSQGGQYSDYGSIGTYTIALNGDPLPQEPLTDAPPNDATGPAPTAPMTGTNGATGTTGTAKAAFTTTALPRARAGKKYKATIRFTGTVTEARVSTLLPPGLRWTVRGDSIVVQGKAPKAKALRITVKLTGPAGTTTGMFLIKKR